MRGVATALCLFALLPAAGARGDERKIVATASVRDEYNSNVFFSSGQKTDSFITTVSPGLDFSNRTERLDTGLGVDLHGQLYSTDKDLNAVAQGYRGRLGYRLTPALRVSGDAGYRRDTRPDREIETTGLFVTYRSDRRNGSVAAEYALDEKTTATASYGYEKTDYSNQSRADYTTGTLSLGLFHDLGRFFPVTTGRATFGFARTDFTGTRVDNFTLAVGASRGVTETWSVQADVGGRYTRSGFDMQRLEFVPPASFVVVQTREESRNRGWIAAVAMKYRGDQNRGSLSFNRDVTVAAGRQGASQRTALVADAERQASAHFAGYVSAGYYLNKSEAGEFSSVTIDERTVRFRPGVRFDFTKEISAEAAWQYTRVLFGQTDTAARQDVVYLRVAIRMPLHE